MHRDQHYVSRCYCLILKTKPLRPRRGNLELSEFTGVGLSLMKTSVLIPTLIQAGGKKLQTDKKYDTLHKASLSKCKSTHAEGGKKRLCIMNY